MALDSENNHDDAVKSILDTRELKRVLFPFWICRCSLMVLMGVTYVSMIWNTSQRIMVRGGLLASTILVILLNVLCISIDLVSTILLSSQALKPGTFLSFQIMETTVWTVVLALEVYSAVGIRASNYMILTISSILYLSFIGLLAYASVIFYRSRHNSSTSGTTTTDHLSDLSLHSRDPFHDTHATAFPARTLSTRSHDSNPPPPYSNRYSILSTRIRNSFIIFSHPTSPQKHRRTSARYPTSFVIDSLPEDSVTRPSQAHNSFEVHSMPEEAPSWSSPIKTEGKENPDAHRYA